ncbi:MAG TPA: hypothetical protein RMF84_04275 [Polyangiaceae bacterium LLY-WYZ-14_1]|nr:hypothetical protein [Polyangiaceae bacterium LLY-WYZ-14_1]
MPAADPTTMFDRLPTAHVLRTLTACLAAFSGLGCEERSERAMEELAENRAERRAERLDLPEDTEQALRDRAEERAEAVHNALELTHGDTSVPVRTVMLQDRDDDGDRLILYRDEVSCATVRELPGDDRVVARAEIVPGFDERPGVGDMATRNWVFRVEDQGDVDVDGTPEVEVTRVATSEPTVDGTMVLTSRIADQRVELDGPFTATICQI